MADEKYVSIPFSVWENKYKPMEEENQRLRDQFKEGTITIRIYLGGIRHQKSYRGEIGYIDYIVGAEWPPNKIEWNERNKLQGEVSNAINKAIVNTPGIGYYLSKELAEKTLTQMNAVRQNAENAIEENRKRIAGIPKLIKWIFNIKA
jgi:hypothetical protein